MLLSINEEELNLDSWIHALYYSLKRGSEASNHPKLVRNDPMIVVPTGSQWFREVWKCQTTPNSCQASPQAWIHMVLSINEEELTLDSHGSMHCIMV